MCEQARRGRGRLRKLDAIPPLIVDVATEPASPVADATVLPPDKIDSPSPKGSRRQWGLVAGILFVHALLCGHVASVKTVTHDEIWHLPVGVRNLREGNFSVDRLNPPLSRLWAAIPLVISGVDVDRTVDGPDTGKKFVQDHPRDFQRWYLCGRMFNVVWSLLTGLLIYTWSTQLFGPTAGFVTLLLYVCCPNVIAHSSLVTPDAGLMFGYVATLYVLCRWQARPGWSASILLGVAMGVAQAIKFTAVLLVPLVLLAAVWRLWQDRREGHKRIGPVVGQTLLALAISLLVLAATYGFQGLFQPLKSFPFQSADLRTIQKLFDIAGGLPLPLPADYLLGFDAQRAIMAGGHPVFLDGAWALTGFRGYYLWTLLYKLPHVTQLLIVIGIVTSFRSWRSSHPFAWGALALSVALLLGIASFSGMQLGIRYVLPVLPLLFVMAGSAAVVTECWSRRARRWGTLVLVLACAFSLRFQPHQLAYFNELAGGPTGGRFHLLDSNLDWGQDLRLVKEFMDEQGLETIGLAYFGTIDPLLIGIDYQVPPSWSPQPGWYAVSVNYVMGRPHVILEADGTWRGTDFQEFGYFREYEPVTTLGGSIDIYHLPPGP